MFGTNKSGSVILVVVKGKKKKSGALAAKAALVAGVLLASALLAYFGAAPGNHYLGCNFDESVSCPDGYRIITARCDGSVLTSLRGTGLAELSCAGHDKPAYAPAPRTEPVKTGSAPPDEPETFACKADADCKLVPGGCCPCEMGGTQVAINAAFANAWGEYFSRYCGGIACPAVYSCKTGEKAACVGGKCEIAGATAAKSFPTPAPAGFASVSGALGGLVHDRLGLTGPCVANAYAGTGAYYCASAANASTGLADYVFSVEKTQSPGAYRVPEGFENRASNGKKYHYQEETKSGKPFAGVQVFCENYTMKIYASFVIGPAGGEGLSEGLAALCT